MLECNFSVTYHLWSIGEVRITEVPQVWEHEEGISNIRWLEETAILLPPQS